MSEHEGVRVIRICTSCERRAGGDLPVCMQCGADLDERVTVRTGNDAPPPPPAMPARDSVLAWDPPRLGGEVAPGTGASLVRQAAIAGQGLIALDYGVAVLMRGSALLGGDGTVLGAAGLILPAFLAWTFVRRMRGVARRYDREAFRDLRALNVVVAVLFGIGTAYALGVSPSVAVLAVVDMAVVLGATVAAEAAARVLPSCFAP